MHGQLQGQRRRHHQHRHQHHQRYHRQQLPVIDWLGSASPTVPTHRPRHQLEGMLPLALPPPPPLLLLLLQRWCGP
jgi:hypothetical protein